MEVNQPQDEQKTYWFPTTEQPGGSGYIHTHATTDLWLPPGTEAIWATKPKWHRRVKKKNSSTISTDRTPALARLKKDVEDILVQYHDIFARHRFDIGTNREI